MARSLEIVVREQLVAYLAGDLSVDDFKDWLVDITWDPATADETDGLHLANRIKLAFAEHSGGFRADDELREELDRMLSVVVVD